MQLLFTALAFSMMVALSYFFMSGVVDTHLLRNTKNALDCEQSKIEDNALHLKVTLGNFSRTMRDRILRGDSAEKLDTHIKDLSGYTRANSQFVSGFDDFFCYLETLPGGPVFMTGAGWSPPDNYIPTERPWYLKALAAGGDFAEMLSYADAASKETMVIYSIGIFDAAGRRLGVIGLRAKLGLIGKEIVETVMDQGSYGMLISRELIVLAHYNPAFVGKSMRDPVLPISVFVDDLLNGIEISDRSMLSYKHETSVAFFRTLSNGWILGIVAPRGPYYQSVVHTALILCALGTLFAAMLMYVLVRIDAAKNKANEESRQKSTFLATMSHEIRTPMNAIIGMTIIGKSAAGIERKDYCLTKIEDASQHLLGVINDILDISKIEADKFELSSESFHFEKMLQRLVHVINFRIDEKRQKFMVRIDKAIPKFLIGDAQRLAQVITNLLGNAIKFTPEQGAITLDARLAGETADACVIRFAVTDTGIGIHSDHQAELFQSFHQIEASITRKYGGTGLGLAISKRIVAMMGGRIWVESEFGKGATFAFTVRMKRGELTERRRPPLGAQWDKARILVVDDAREILDLFTEITRELGLACDTATSGDAALERVAQNGPYALYFVDWIMPGMNGITLARALKARSSRPGDTVIVMISSAELGAVEEAAKQAGVDKFLPKPLFPSVIEDTIREAFGAQQQQPDAKERDIAGMFAQRRMLLVEDVDINREIALTLLEPTHIQIDCAENGAEAVRMFCNAPDAYDVILMDVQMPEMDGYEATRRIRSLDLPNAGTIPILAMTAHVFREDIEKCRAAGMDDHIAKPLNYNEILQKLRKVIPLRTRD